jgi:hypothetical protein
VVGCASLGENPMRMNGEAVLQDLLDVPL